MIHLEPLGEWAYLVRFDDDVSAPSWASAVRELALPGVNDVVSAYRSAAVYLDPENSDPAWIEARLSGLQVDGTRQSKGPLRQVPVLYDGDDLNKVARALRLRIDDVVNLHCQCEYRVFAVGFLPGFPYAGYLPSGLSGLPRRDVPRTRVPAGSVAIAGRQTGIYPCDSPGGWHLIGRTPLMIVGMDDAYFPIQAGDRLQFLPMTRSDYERRQGERL